MKLEGKYIEVSDECDSRAAQNRAFDLGWEWKSSGKKIINTSSIGFRMEKGKRVMVTGAREPKFV